MTRARRASGPSRRVALLRAVNLAGRNRVPMADLRALAEEAGLRDPRTLLQSGNLVFGSSAAPAALATLLERSLHERLGLDVDVFVRTASEWTALVEANPLPDEARRDPARLLLLALNEPPGARATAALVGAIPGREVVRVIGREAYAFYPDGIGRSRLTTALVEKHLGTRVTGRNWNTVLKLRDLLEA